jgi:uncharacterized protein (TIGR00725 family)
MRGSILVLTLAVASAAQAASAPKPAPATPIKLVFVPPPPLRRQVSVMGAGEPTRAQTRWAVRVGELLARRGVIVATGGRGGVMADAMRGAKRAGGQTLAILPGADIEKANPYADAVVATTMNESRNAAVAASNNAAIAIGDGWGTTSEIALAKKMGHYVVILDGLRLPGVTRARYPKQAVDRVMAQFARMDAARLEAAKKAFHKAEEAAAKKLVDGPADIAPAQ